jgi:hypothetical protein
LVNYQLEHGAAIRGKDEAFIADPMLLFLDEGSGGEVNVDGGKVAVFHGLRCSARGIAGERHCTEG